MCYGKGGTTPTVTDADVVLGTINPDNFLGGRIKLDRKKAVEAVQRVADGLGLTLFQAAAGIAQIAEFKMADIIRKMTVEKGLDPRDFVLFAFGADRRMRACSLRARRAKGGHPAQNRLLVRLSQRVG